MIFELKDLNHSFTQIKNLETSSDVSTFKLALLETLSAFEDGYQFSIEYRQNMWDGKKKFYEILEKNVIVFPKGLVSLVLEALIEYNFRPQIDFTYTTNTSHFQLENNELDNFITSLNLKYTPYKYQKKAINDMIIKKRGIFRSATSSGKSLMIYVTTRYLLNQNKNIILIVPSISLVEQMYSDFIDYGWSEEDIEKSVKRIGGEHNSVKGFNKDLTEKPMIITTWQSIYQLDTEAFDCLDCVLVDEVHQAKQGVLEELIYKIKNAEWRLGLTGTVPYMKVHKLSLTASLGRVYTVIKAKELIDLGLATNVTINAVYINYNNNDRLAFKIPYPDEKQFIESHSGRTNFTAKLLDKISEQGNSIGLFDRFEQGSSILEELITSRLGKREEFTMLYDITLQRIATVYELWKANNNIRIYVNSDISDKDRTDILYAAEYIPNSNIPSFLSNIVFTSNKSLINMNKIGSKPVADAYSLFNQGETLYFDISKLKYYSNDVYSKEDFITNKSSFIDIIKQHNLNKIEVYANKIPHIDASEFVKSIKSLAELNIYFYNGSVKPFVREKVRQELETIDNNSFKLVFPSFTTFIKGDLEYLLEDGSFIRGCDISLDSDLKIINNNIVIK